MGKLVGKRRRHRCGFENEMTISEGCSERLDKGRQKIRSDSQQPV